MVEVSPDSLTSDTTDTTVEGWSWGSWQVILLLANAGLGLVAFEWAWYMMYRYRKPIPELEELMPAFRRDDSKRWAKWKFYPGAVTIMLPRLIFGIVLGLTLCIFLKIMLIGQPL